MSPAAGRYPVVPRIAQQSSILRVVLSSLGGQLRATPLSSGLSNSLKTPFYIHLTVCNPIGEYIPIPKRVRI